MASAEPRGAMADGRRRQLARAVPAAVLGPVRVAVLADLGARPPQQTDHHRDARRTRGRPTPAATPGRPARRDGVPGPGRLPGVEFSPRPGPRRRGHQAARPLTGRPARCAVGAHRRGRDPDDWQAGRPAATPVADARGLAPWLAGSVGADRRRGCGAADRRRADRRRAAKGQPRPARPGDQQAQARQPRSAARGMAALARPAVGDRKRRNVQTITTRSDRGCGHPYGSTSKASACLGRRIAKSRRSSV